LVAIDAKPSPSKGIFKFQLFLAGSWSFLNKTYGGTPVRSDLVAAMKFPPDCFPMKRPQKDYFGARSVRTQL